MNKAIFNGYIAKKLLHKGHKIIDIQKNKTVANATVFYFVETDELLNDLSEITHKLQKNSTKVQV
jgi:hypothetical protein